MAARGFISEPFTVSLVFTFENNHPSGNFKIILLNRCARTWTKIVMLMFLSIVPAINLENGSKQLVFFVLFTRPASPSGIYGSLLLPLVLLTTTAKKKTLFAGIHVSSRGIAGFENVRANCFFASLLRTAARANSHATSCIERAFQVRKWTMLGQMAIAIALLRFNDLGRSVTPTFLFRNRFYLQLSPQCSKMNKKSMWEVKTISRFLSTGHGILPSCGCKTRETMVSKCELILWGTSPVD